MVLATTMTMTAETKFREEEAGRLVELALAGLTREYPNKPGHMMAGPEEVKSPKALFPVFYGHFDWHSSVHGHWTLVRLLRIYPEAEWAARVRSGLDGKLTSEGLQAEAGYLAKHKSFERMYGWAWALRLGMELRSLDSEEGKRWARHFAPVEKAIVANAKEHLPKLDWPIRCGFHPESSFALGQMLDWSRATGEEAFEELLLAKARAFYAGDRNYPAAYEPSGHDFFSMGLNEADLMRRVLPAEEYGAWLTGFLPELASGKAGNLLSPVKVRDLTDGHLVHLVGLNLNRAWTMRGVASALAESDSRKKVLLESASLHERAGMKDVWSGSYEGEHWLGSFATYLKTDVGVAP
jgi:hypothetical protein